MDETGEVEGLEGSDIGGGDNDDGSRTLDPVLDPLLHLYPFDELVGLHDLIGVRVGPGPDADPVPPHYDAAAGAIERVEEGWVLNLGMGLGLCLQGQDHRFGGAAEQGGGVGGEE